jgi:hypothetical protein
MKIKDFEVTWADGVGTHDTRTRILSRITMRRILPLRRRMHCSCLNRPNIKTALSNVASKGVKLYDVLSTAEAR